MSLDTCPHCGATKILCNIRFGQNAEVGILGPQYQMMRFMVGTEELLVDLCTGCGTVVRFHVRETNRKWIVKD